MPTQGWEFPVRLIHSDDGTTPCGAAPLPDVDASVDRWIDPAGHVHGHSIGTGDCYLIHLYGAGSFAFSRHSDLVRGVREPGVTPEAFEEVFRRQILPFVLQQQCWEVLHASGLVVAGAFIALCGDSQTGKSTLAHAWRRRGGDVFADDAIPFRVEGDFARLRPIPFQLRLRPPALRHFGLADAASMAVPVGGLALAAEDGALLRAMYLLDRRKDEEEGPVWIAPSVVEEALRGLLKQAYCLTLRDRARNQQMVESYLNLMNAVPTFHLSYPTGLGHVETILDQLHTHVTGLTTGGAERVGTHR
jgi:hypothetical protein